MRACPSCQQHVLAADAACPFCGASMRPGFARRVRGMLVVSAIAVSGCMVLIPQPMPVYGAPVPPSASPATSPSPAPIPPYGVPPVSEREASPTPPPATPVYGVPAPPEQQQP